MTRKYPMVEFGDNGRRRGRRPRLLQLHLLLPFLLLVTLRLNDRHYNNYSFPFAFFVVVMGAQAQQQQQQKQKQKQDQRRASLSKRRKQRHRIGREKTTRAIPYLGEEEEEYEEGRLLQNNNRRRRRRSPRNNSKKVDTKKASKKDNPQTPLLPPGPNFPVSQTTSVSDVNCNADIIPAILFGDGTTINGEWTTGTSTTTTTTLFNDGSFTSDSQTIQVGLRPRVLFDDSGNPQNSFNGFGDGTYLFQSGVPTSQSFPVAEWTIDWGVNSDVGCDASSSSLSPLLPLACFPLSVVQWQFFMDVDSTYDTDFRPVYDSNDVINGLNYDTALIGNGNVFWDHRFGTLSTSDPTDAVVATTPVDYINIIDSATVGQNSFRPDEMIPRGLSFDPTVPGVYDFLLRGIPRTSIPPPPPPPPFFNNNNNNNFPFLFFPPNGGGGVVDDRIAEARIRIIVQDSTPSSPAPLFPPQNVNDCIGTPAELFDRFGYIFDTALECQNFLSSDDLCNRGGIIGNPFLSFP